MKVVVTLERRFERTPDGAVWTRGDGAHRFWSRYLSAFSEVTVVARTREVTSPAEGSSRVDGPGVSVAALPHYVGPGAYLRHWYRVRRTLRQAAAPPHAVILRVPSAMAATVVPLLQSQGRPYGVEVLGDPHEVFAPGAVGHPLARFFRWWFPRNLRAECASACAAAYVTKDALQSRYPCGGRAIAVSDVDVAAPDFVPGARAFRNHEKARRWVIVSVGSMEQLYKGTDVLLDAVAIALRRGVDLELRLAGEGRVRPALERRAAALGIAERVRFLGQLPDGGAVRARLDQADLFVLPSRTEGLPRAMVEAMARAVPCIGTRVGGVPELLEDEDLVPSGDAAGLAGKIEEVLGRPRLAAMSRRNLAKAAQYRDDLLAPRRNEFYRQVRESTQEWLRSLPSPCQDSASPLPARTAPSPLPARERGRGEGQA